MEATSNLSLADGAFDICVEFPQEGFSIKICLSMPIKAYHTSSWLLSETIALFSQECKSRSLSPKKDDPIVALNSKIADLDIDYLLTLPNQPLTFLSHNVVLVPYYPSLPSLLAAGGISQCKNCETLFQNHIDAQYKTIHLALEDFEVIAKICRKAAAIAKSSHVKQQKQVETESEERKSEKVQNGDTWRESATQAKDHLPVGCSSSIYLARMKIDGKFYVLKQLPKTGLLPEDQQKIITERNIMLQINSPFIMALRYAFQTAGYCYLVMDYSPYGTLLQLISRVGKLPEKDAKFFVGGVLVALEALHSQNIIYRDLKPDNVLIDSDGFVKLCDFGLSKVVENPKCLNTTICGNLHYMSPEMLQSQGYDHRADFYSLGLLAYELLTGKLPFKNESTISSTQNSNKGASSLMSITNVMHRIKNEKLEYPKDISDSARDFIERLSCKNPKKRLGAKGGINEIWKHAWLKGVDLKKMRSRNSDVSEWSTLRLILPSCFPKVERSIEQEPSKKELKGKDSKLDFFCIGLSNFVYDRKPEKGSKSDQQMFTFSDDECYMDDTEEFCEDMQQNHMKFKNYSIIASLKNKIPFTP